MPTPLTRHRDPDLSFVEETSRSVARSLRKGQLVVLESTTYPGTTDDVVKPLLEETGLKSGHDFFLGFSPEREDPGNAHFETATIPKVVAGDGPKAASLMSAFYGQVVASVVPVSSNATAEAVKLTENIFRAVNIALVNELKILYDAMGIDVWEVIDAATFSVPEMKDPDPKQRERWQRLWRVSTLALHKYDPAGSLLVPTTLSPPTPPMQGRWTCH